MAHKQMPRIVEITVPPQLTTNLAQRISKLGQVISIRIEKGISVQPPGDLVTIEIADRTLPRLFDVLEEMGVNGSPSASVTTSRPESIVSKTAAQTIVRDSSEATWEELENLLNRESGATLNSLVVMVLAGMIAAIGILTNTLHVVIGAMVIAPGFEPISRISLGLISRSLAWKRGLVDTVKGYLALAAGASVATLVIQQLSSFPSDSTSTYLPQDSLFDYWTTISAPSLFVSLAAGMAGGILVITMRSVLTAGVMVALALVPATALVGIGIVFTDMALAGKGFARLAIEIGLVLGTSLLVFSWKRYRIEKRRMSM